MHLGWWGRALPLSRGRVVRESVVAHNRYRVDDCRYFGRVLKICDAKYKGEEWKRLELASAAEDSSGGEFLKTVQSPLT